MEADWTNNGIGFVVHGVHCGWGHVFNDASDCFDAEHECWRAIVQEQRHTLTVIAEAAEEAAQGWYDAGLCSDPDPTAFACETARKARRHIPQPPEPDSNAQ
jgi:hypothetical protein